jgi:hypothetical protein
MKREEIATFNRYAEYLTYSDYNIREFNERAKWEWTKIVKARYRILSQWWKKLSKDEKSEYRKIIEQCVRFEENGLISHDGVLEFDIMEAILEFSKTFKATERIAPRLIFDCRRGQSGQTDLYVKLRFDVWYMFIRNCRFWRRVRNEDLGT